MPDIALAVLVFAPLVITYFLKSNAALGFLALCAGFVLSTSVIGDLKHLLSETNLSVANDTLALGLVILPLLITLLLTRHGRARGPLFALHLLAALAAGGLLALSAGPLINSTTSFDVLDSGFWTQLGKYQSGIIGIGGLLSLVLVWASGAHRSKKH